MILLFLSQYFATFVIFISIRRSTSRAARIMEKKVEEKEKEMLSMLYPPYSLGQ